MSRFEVRRTLFTGAVVLLLASGTARAQELVAPDSTPTPIPGLRLDLQRAPLVETRLPGPGSPASMVLRQDSLPCPDCEPRPKHFWAASAELLTTLLVPWAYNYYVRDAAFARVGLQSWKHNLTNPWVWDDNTFQTNQVAHPLHGAFYFNAFRTNGYNFWASSIAAGAGAFLWECCGETHPPAPNDLLNTSLGGIALGEMMFRLSNLVLDNTATGSERTWREIGGFLLSPYNGLNRLMRGQMNDHVANPPGWRPSAIQAAFDIGGRSLGTQGTSFDVVDSAQHDIFVAFRLIYGRPVADLTGKPFSTFSLNAELASTKNRQALQGLQVVGNLTGKVLKDSPTTRHVFGVRMHYDYNFVPNSDTTFNAVVYEYGAQSFTGGLHSFFQLSPRWRLLTDASMRIVALGAVRSDYYEVTGEGRNYDFGPGMGGVLQASLVRPGRMLVNAAYSFTWIHTLNGSDYNHQLHQGSLDARYYFAQRYGIGARFDTFYRYSHPADPATAPGPATTLKVPQLRLYVSTTIPRWEIN